MTLNKIYVPTCLPTLLNNILNAILCCVLGIWMYVKKNSCNYDNSFNNNMWLMKAHNDTHFNDVINFHSCFQTFLVSCLRNHQGSILKNRGILRWHCTCIPAKHILIFERLWGSVCPRQGPYAGKSFLKKIDNLL